MTYELAFPKCPTKGEACELWPDPVTLLLQAVGWVVGVGLVVTLLVYLMVDLRKSRRGRP